MPTGNKVTDRYEVRQTLGQGGIGIVYWAYDTLIHRDVALKTIRDAPEQAALDLFYKECNIVASISHPNIIEIFDIGEFEDEGARKPYFAMPLLKGLTLDGLIRNSSRRLTVERTIEILSQTCRGLQAAHERGLVHRDLKPSNIFVLEDDSVKIIDFGVAQLADSHTASSAKGTLLYMSPEQIQLKPATALSDIFTVGVVAYEALTLRHPFDGATHRDIANAILQHIPPPASDLNPDVNPPLGRVVHKTMAKQPFNRFSTARDLADALQKALRNEPIESFDSARIQARIERANRAFESGDREFASEILTELESEGHLDPAMAPLRRKIDQAMRQKTLARLLESARTRLEDQEYPLALQKIQDALEIDPENAEALSLKSEIESSRIARQVEELLSLAHRHLDRFAFNDARQAVENILQIQPSNPQALELTAEIQRREQQLLQARQEKEKLYQSAVEAHGKFEFSSALSKMERVLELEKRAPETASTGRGAIYQKFYDQIRSEQESSTAAYTEARRALAEENLDRAGEIIDAALKKYPGQALFQALKLDIEDRRRRKRSAFIAEVDCNVEAEPDLDKRIEILHSAAELCPGERRFEEALKLIREKRDLVNSIVARARGHEQLDQFNEALEQWELLRTVYGQYPGLESEIARVSKGHVPPTSHDSKAHWTDQIDRMIDQRDYNQAAALLQEAQNELPGDAELEELAKRIHQGEEHNVVAQFLADQARAYNAKGKFEEAARLLRQAWESDQRDVAIRGLLVDTLVQHARSLLESDARRAAELVQAALKLEPANSQTRVVAAQIDDRKRDEAIDQCFQHASQLQSGGDPASALASVEQSLRLYPGAPRLTQLRATLQQGIGDADPTPSRQSDLEKLTNLEARAESEQDPNVQREILSSVRALAAKYLDDPEFQTALIAIEKRYVSLSRPGHPAAQPVAQKAAAVDMEATVVFRLPMMDVAPPVPGPPPVPAARPPVPPPPPPLADKKRVSAPPPIPSPPPVQAAKPPAPSPDKEHQLLTALALATKQSAPQPPPAAPPSPETKPVSAPPPVSPPPPKPPASQPRNWTLWAGAAGGILLVLAATTGALLVHRHQSPAAPAVTQFPVDIRTSPDGASILVNNKPSGTSNLHLMLMPGIYRIDALRDGFRPSQTTVRVTAGASNAADIKLEPLASSLRLLTDYPFALVTLDGQPQSSLQNGQMILDKVADGSHILKFVSGTSSAAIHFDARTGAPPVVTGVEAAKDTSTILITNLGTSGRIYSGQKTGSITFDGKPVGQVDPLGIELSNMGPGDHQITIGEGEERRKLVYESSSAPAVTIFVNNPKSQQALGIITVNTGEDDVVVSLDGKPQRTATRRGQLRIPNLPVKEYVVSVAKDGFQPVEEQRVAVKKGEEAKVAFQLRPILKIATLRLAGAVPGTQVLVDGKPIGTSGQDGGLPAVQVSPGNHRVELRKEEYKPKIYDLSFSAGENRTLTGADAVLEATFGTLTISVTPPNAQVTIQRSGESQARPLTGGSIHLPVGTYTVNATLPHFVPHSSSFEITGGSAKNVTIELAAERVAPPPKPVVLHVGMSGWQDPWQADGDHFTRHGGNLCLFKPQGPGTYSFTATMKHGKQLRWVAHETDDKNYAEFELDNEYFTRSIVTNGKSNQLVRRKHGLSMEPVGATLQITISPAGIMQRIQTSNGWTALDSWTGTALQEGRFGFMIRGRDEVNLSGFSFTGAE